MLTEIYGKTSGHFQKNVNLLVLDMSSFFLLQFSSVTQLCLTLCDPMNRSTPGLPVHHQLPQSTQTHVHRVRDAIQPSHPLSSPSPPALNLSQHQFSSVAQSCLTLCNLMAAAGQASLSITNTRSLLKLMSIESVMPSNHLILCHPRPESPGRVPSPSRLAPSVL